jgi:protein-disulfide isomerase
MKKHIGKSIFLAVVLLIGAAFWYGSVAGAKANEGVVITPHTLVGSNSKITLTEYADFECPACAQFHPVVKDVLDKYGSQITFEFKHFPLSNIHKFALPAAKAAEAAGQQGQFFGMYDKLFENQAAWSKSPTPQAFFIKYAEELGLDMEKFKQHMRASVITEHIKTQFDDARALGLTGTPSFYLNGERLEYKSIPEFTQKIEAALGAGTSTVGEENVPAVQFGLPSDLQAI